MKGIPGCGKGAWTQVMRINGSKIFFKIIMIIIIIIIIIIILFKSKMHS